VLVQIATEDTASVVLNFDNGTTRRIDRDMVFMMQAQHFIDCIKGKAKPRCTLKEAEQTLKTMLAALQSSDSDGRFVRADIC